MPTSCHACNSSENATGILSSRGVRLTKLRREVLQILHHAAQPIGAYALFERLKSHGKASAPPAVYRVLDFLVEQGLAHKLRSTAGYAACRRGPHNHPAAFLICKKCGDANEFDCPTTKFSQQASRQNFRLESLTLEAIGLCEACQ